MTMEDYELNGDETTALPVWIEIPLLVGAALVLGMVLRHFVAETFAIPTGSMEQTIQPGDRVFGEKLSKHWQTPQYGDIVTFIDPDGSGSTLIKRVIATEGQVVDIQDGGLFVDGVRLEEDYVGGQPSQPIAAHAANLTEDVSYPFVVPEGCIWVMGDNRNNSLDSRYFGAVPVSSVTSKAVCIFWPLSNACML